MCKLVPGSGFFRPTTTPLVGEAEGEHKSQRTKAVFLVAKQKGLRKLSYLYGPFCGNVPHITSRVFLIFYFWILICIMPLRIHLSCVCRTMKLHFQLKGTRDEGALSSKITPSKKINYYSSYRCASVQQNLPIILHLYSQWNPV